jgi:DNA repair exonuclease SbcCD nuclease subunit
MTITKPKFAIFSDLHLGKHNNSADWHKVAIEWCDWFISELKTKNISDVVFGGDWHDNRSEISVHTLDISAILVEKFKDFKLHMVIGNHDIPFKHGTEVNSVSIYANHPNVKVYTKLEYIEAFDRKICLAPWDSDLTKLDKCDVLIGHLEIQTFKMGLAKTCDHGWSVVDLLEKCPNVFSGHFHGRCEKMYNEGNITYVGNPFQMDFGDRYDKKGYYIFDLDGLEFDFFENTISPVHYIIKLSDVIKNGLDKYKLNIVGNIIRLNVDVEMDNKDLMKLYDNISSLKPMIFTPDYTYISNVEESDIDVQDIASIDIRTTIVDYVDSIDIYGKDRCKAYLIELYDNMK